TNSLHQLEQIAAVSTKAVPALADLDEFRFFRDRYKLGDELETALLVISDATIRRWCSPRWRIATSRRTRGAAILSDLHAGHMAQLTSGIKTPIAVEVGPSAFSLNRFTLLDHAAISPAMGTLAFQTPIGEMDIQQISGREKQAYENWREGYQSNWSNAFDPIAIRMSLQEGKLAADLTVLPLIDNSEYESMIDVSAGAQLDPQRNFRHDKALLWFGLALNKESPTLKQFGNMGSTFAGSNFMDWLGDAVIIYVDEDPFWVDLQQLEINEDRQTAFNDFFEQNIHRLPVALQFNVASSFRLTAFLVGLRAFIEQSAPDMTSWETLHHLEQAYVKVSPAPSARREMLGEFDDKIALYYLATSDTLIFSLSESVIQNAIQKRAGSGSKEKLNTVDPSRTMLGKNAAFQIKRSLASGASAFFADDYQQRMQSQSWAALPILNEWKRMFPDRDPVEVDRLVWSRELTCPGGGKYQWNALAKTMESSVYGHPAEPKQGPDLSQLFGQWNSGDFGLTFENQGLRARIELDQ
ncbi:MAG: hypothetical protein GY904_35370, partial [Planctomycetaceae bacterium]|nr:hypothetical protein [Planctomycetaceae bacterium]